MVVDVHSPDVQPSNPTEMFSPGDLQQPDSTQDSDQTSYRDFPTPTTVAYADDYNVSMVNPGANYNFSMVNPDLFNPGQHSVIVPLSADTSAWTTAWPTLDQDITRNKLFS